MRSVIYPCSFDPITNGHLDVIVRALALFDQVIVAVGDNPEKESLFTTDDKMAMIRTATQDLAHVEVDHFAGLLVDNARQKGDVTIIRGRRSLSYLEH